METIEFKRGDTFSLVCTYKVADVATSLTNFTITSQLRNSNDVLIETLIVEKLIDTGKFLLKSNDTSDWQPNLLSCDIQFIENGVIRSTNTFYVSVVKDITR